MGISSSPATVCFRNKEFLMTSLITKMGSREGVSRSTDAQILWNSLTYKALWNWMSNSPNHTVKWDTRSSPAIVGISILCIQCLTRSFPLVYFRPSIRPPFSEILSSRGPSSAVVTGPDIKTRGYATRTWASWWHSDLTVDYWEKTAYAWKRRSQASFQLNRQDEYCGSFCCSITAKNVPTNVCESIDWPLG